MGICTRAWMFSKLWKFKHHPEVPHPGISCKKPWENDSVAHWDASITYEGLQGWSLENADCTMWMHFRDADDIDWPIFLSVISLTFSENNFSKCIISPSYTLKKCYFQLLLDPISHKGFIHVSPEECMQQKLTVKKNDRLDTYTNERVKKMIITPHCQK